MKRAIGMVLTAWTRAAQLPPAAQGDGFWSCDAFVGEGRIFDSGLCDG